MNKERQVRIDKAQETAERLRLETEASKQAEAEKQAELLAQQEIVKKERLKRTKIAQETADKLKLETEAKEKETVDRIVEEISNTETERCARNINGIIQSSISLKSLAGATIDMYYDGQNLESTTTDENGEFHFNNVDCNTKYTLICFKKEYNNIAKAVINTEFVPDQIVLLLDPDPEIIVQKVIIEKKEVEIATIAIQKEKPIEKNTEETTLEEETTVRLNEQNIEKEVEIVQESTESDVVSQIADVKESKIETPKIIGRKIQLNPIYFDLDEHYLTLPARRELDKIIVLMIQNPTMIIESGSHTDTRGPFDYNLELSEKRSQEAVGYIVANGIDQDRVSGRGYGETIPLNHCLDGVKCSEKEHLVNRRTEFIVLKQ